MTDSMNWSRAAIETARLDLLGRLANDQSNHVKGIIMASEGQRKSSIPESNWNTDDMTDRVMEVIQSSLSKARSVIEAGGTWSPLLHILHPEEIVSARFPGLSEDPREKGRVISQISSKMKELNATLAIMITDTWVANETQKNSVTGSQHHPFSGSAEALMVAIWGPDGVATCGAQMYSRCSTGKVEFEELEWAEPLKESVSRFGSGDMKGSSDGAGAAPASRKARIH